MLCYATIDVSSAVAMRKRAVYSSSHEAFFFFSLLALRTRPVVEIWTYSDLKTLIGQDEGGVGGGELGGRHYC